MDVVQAIKERRSIRRYRSEPVSEEALHTVLEAARWAPSWGNTQCWRLIVVRDQATKSKLVSTLRSSRPEAKNGAIDAVKSAPIVIVACAENSRSGCYRVGNKQGMPAKEKRRVPSKAAKKQDFYSKVLDEAEKLDFELASGVDGIDDEIALLRVKIKSILAHDPDNIRLIMEATDMMAKLVKTRYNVTKEQKKGLKEAIGNVIKDIAVPLGVAVISKSS